MRLPRHESCACTWTIREVGWLRHAAYQRTNNVWRGFHHRTLQLDTQGFLMLKVNFDAKTFFISTSAVAWDGILGGLFTFVLFWTLSFGLVHIF